MEKKLDLENERLQAEYPEAEIEVWAIDEHRLGLKPLQRRVWALQGEQPIAAVKWRFQWLWLYGFVHPESGETYWWILPRVNRFAKVKSQKSKVKSITPSMNRGA